MTSVFIATDSSTASVTSASTRHERLRAGLILNLIAFLNSCDPGLGLLARRNLKLLDAHELTLVLLRRTIADVFSFAGIDNNSLSILKTTLHIIIIFGHTSTMAWRNGTACLLLYLSVARIYFQKDAFSISICQILSPIAQDRLFITTIFRLLVVWVVPLHGQYLFNCRFVDRLLLFLTLNLSLFLESSFFCDGVIDEGAPFLQPHDSLIQVSFMKVCTRKGAHILFCSLATAENLPQLITVHLEWHWIIQTDQLLRLECISTTIARYTNRIRTVQTLHTVNAYEVSHASVHLFSIKELEGKVIVWG